MDLNRRMLLAGASAIGTAATAQAATALPGKRRFDPRDYHDQVHGPRTRVLVLASPHISGAPDSFDPVVLEPLLQRLQAFAPDFICIEALSGESVDLLWRNRAVYPGVATTYGGYTELIAAAGRVNTGLDMAEAEAEARRELAKWPANPTAAQRRRMTAVLASAGDPYSALLQWWRLDPSERRPGDGVGRTLADRLGQQDRSRNENDVIGVRLGVRLGHDRIYSIDDHAADDLVIPLGEDLEAFVSQPWFQAVIEEPSFKRLSQASQALTTPQQALATYQMLNAPQTGRIDADGQWLNFINRESVNDVGRRKVAEWEARNLRQAAHIREVTAVKPGGRVLVIMGSSHKPWIDHYLGMMMDLEIVDAEAVLR